MAGFLLVFASVAQAGTLSRVDATTLRYDADPGETNRIFVSTDSEGVRVIDTSATVTAGAGARAGRPVKATGGNPEKQAGTRLEIHAGDKDDYVKILPGTLGSAFVEGGAGEDELIGGGAVYDNWLDGGPGADILGGAALVDYHSRTSPSP